MGETALGDFAGAKLRGYDSTLESVRTSVTRLVLDGCSRNAIRRCGAMFDAATLVEPF